MGVKDNKFVHVFRFPYLRTRKFSQVLGTHPETLVKGSEPVTSSCLANYINLSVLDNSSLQAAYFCAYEITLFYLLRKFDSL